MVVLTKEQYQSAVARLAHRYQVKGTPQESAQALLQTMPEEELLAEVYRDRVGLMDGWARMAHRAHEATTFEELREAGEEFGRAIGTDAARAMILAVATLSGRTLGEMATHLRSLPRFNQMQAQWAAQGLEGSVAVALEEAAAVEVVVEEGRALLVLTSPQAPAAVNILARSGGAGAAGGHSGTVVIQHRGGNKQVVLGNGERWHLPRGKGYQDIPADDKLGDELQEAAREVAAKWSPRELTQAERTAINNMRSRGLEHRATLLERQARGRWVERQLNGLFPHLSWNNKGVDITGPAGQSYHYEILSGTESNFTLHGRRMASTFFRMIFF